jgi:signal transduction histidine kinase
VEEHIEHAALVQSHGHLPSVESIAEKREEALLPALLTVTALITLAAWALSKALSRSLTAPLEALEGQIAALDPETRNQRLPPSDSPDLAVIIETLNAYMQRLDQVIERERAFAAAASHELRTPLAVIAGSVEVLKINAKPAVFARIERALQEGSERLDALLALSRRQESPPTDIPLHQHLPALVQHSGLRADIDWQLEPHTLRAPISVVDVVVLNLLRNALRAGGKVSVSLRAERLSVRDQGAGIPDHLLPHVFEPGVRGDHGGTGMGLYIAQQLAEAQGWRLSLSNHPEGGVVADLLLTKMHAPSPLLSRP